MLYKMKCSYFQAAKRASPCILFFDEIDGVAGDRESDGSGVRMLTEILNQMNALLIDETSTVITLSATNRCIHDSLFIWILDYSCINIYDRLRLYTG
jgi:ATP-dependent 26S proteasome regulatory subunit